MKTLQEQYNLIKEGKGHKDVFLKEAKRLFPNIVPNSATFNQTSKLLKQRSVISENIFPLIPSSELNPFSTFDKFVNEEAKATEKKTTKEVEEAETAGYDYKDPKNLDNQIFDQYLNGVRVELEKDPKLDLTGAREKVAKNLEKDPLFYMKNNAFGIEGIGYQELKNQEEPKGKYKSSGYGDIKENDMSTSENLKELLEEAVAGIPSIGNPFLNRKKENYENKFDNFVNEEKEEVKKEEKEPKKEGRMKYDEVLKEAERLGEIAKKKVAERVYERAIAERKKAMMVSEDESLAEFINQGAIKEVEKEIKELEKKLMEVSADKNTMTGGR